MAVIYYSPSLHRRERWALYLAGLAAVLAFLGAGLSRAYYGYTHFGPLAAARWSTPWLVGACLLFAAWLILIFFLVKRARYGVILYRNGLRLGEVETPAERAALRKAQRAARPPAAHRPVSPSLIPWEALTGIAVELVAAGPGRPPLHRATLHFIGGRRLRLAEARPGRSVLAGLFGPVPIENLPELITRLKARLYPRLHPRLRAAFLAGEPLAFGPVSIQRSHLHLKPGFVGGFSGGKTIPWDRLRRVTIQSGCLVVELKNPPGRNDPGLEVARLPVSEIPNLELLLRLIDSSAS